MGGGGNFSVLWVYPQKIVRVWAQDIVCQYLLRKCSRIKGSKTVQHNISFNSEYKFHQNANFKFWVKSTYFSSWKWNTLLYIWRYCNCIAYCSNGLLEKGVKLYSIWEREFLIGLWYIAYDKIIRCVFICIWCKCHFDSWNSSTQKFLSRLLLILLKQRLNKFYGFISHGWVK